MDLFITCPCALPSAGTSSSRHRRKTLAATRRGGCRLVQTRSASQRKERRIWGCRRTYSLMHEELNKPLIQISLRKLNFLSQLPPIPRPFANVLRAKSTAAPNQKAADCFTHTPFVSSWTGCMYQHAYRCSYTTTKRSGNFINGEESPARRGKPGSRSMYIFITTARAKDVAGDFGLPSRQPHAWSHSPKH